MSPRRTGRQLVAFGFLWLSVLLLTVAGLLAGAKAGRLLRWSKADAEVQRSEVSSRIQGSGGRRSRVWGAGVTIRYPVNSQLIETTVDRGFQSAVRPWMEQWAGQYPAGSHRKILFNPADPLEADLNGEWSLASFSSPVEFAAVGVLFLWGSRRLGGAAAPSSQGGPPPG
jgi:Protein of unknown function (DUF3592)